MKGGESKPKHALHLCLQALRLADMQLSAYILDVVVRKTTTAAHCILSTLIQIQTHHKSMSFSCSFFSQWWTASLGRLRRNQSGCWYQVACCLHCLSCKVSWNPQEETLVLNSHKHEHGISPNCLLSFCLAVGFSSIIL